MALIVKAIASQNQLSGFDCLSLSSSFFSSLLTRPYKATKRRWKSDIHCRKSFRECGKVEGRRRREKGAFAPARNCATKALTFSLRVRTSSFDPESEKDNIPCMAAGWQEVPGMGRKSENTGTIRDFQMQEHSMTHIKTGADFDCPVQLCKAQFSQHSQLR